jgi:hypothetical protein
MLVTPEQKEELDIFKPMTFDEVLKNIEKNIREIMGKPWTWDRPLGPPMVNFNEGSHNDLDD